VVSDAEKFRAISTYSVQDTLRMEVLQPREDLLCEILGNGFFETTVFTQATSYGATRNVLQESWRILEKNHLEDEDYLHAQEIRCFFKPEVLDDV